MIRQLEYFCVAAFEARRIGSIFLVKACALASAISLMVSTCAAANEVVALQGGTIIDGTGSAPMESGVIVIRDGRIAEIGTVDRVQAPEDAEQIDCRGKFIMPGLISAHSHVGQVDGLENGSVNYNRDNILRQLRQYETYGVTTVAALGLNGPLFYELRDALHAGALPGADLFGADRGLGVAGGAPPAAALNVVDDQIDRPESAEQARAAVRAAKQRGADLIKIWLDDFQGTLPLKMKPEIYMAIIDEAHRQNLRVAAHVFYLQDAKDVVRAGVDILAHGVRDQAVDDELIQLLKSKSVWYVPTLGVDESNYVHAKHPEWLRDDFYVGALQPAVKAQFETAAWRDRTLANPSLPKWQKNVAVNMRNLKALHDAGVAIGFGSDSGANPLRIPGFAEHRELQLMCDAGLTPAQAIAIATSNAAKLLGLSDRGVLAVDKLADLVVLNADPTKDIANTYQIHSVWHRGKLAGKAEKTAQSRDPSAEFVVTALTPFWRATEIRDPMFFIQSEGAALPTVNLLFKPTEILRVESATRETAFEAGTDYEVDVAAGAIRRTKDSKIPFKTLDELYPLMTSDLPKINRQGGDTTRGIFFGEGSVYHELQTEAVYRFEPGQWKGPVPKYAGASLPKTVAKLRAKQPVNLILCGDSISAGANASLMTKAPPGCPAYGELTALALEKHFGSKVTFTNHAVGGWTSANGLQQAKEQQIGKTKPDLVIIAFGMNDVFQRDAAAYQANVRGIMDTIRADAPDAEFILVASMLGNSEWGMPMEQFPLYRDALAKLCGPGVTLADLTSMWKALLERKSFYDLTGNGVNHPNDFGHCVYAQTVLALLIEEPKY